MRDVVEDVGPSDEIELAVWWHLGRMMRKLDPELFTRRLQEIDDAMEQTPPR